MIEKSESSTISIIRSIAMSCIFLCHIQQALNIKWAWIFNVGVQIFLALSGWLYGKKNITNWNLWYKDKIYKLYMPYIVYIFAIYLIYNFVQSDFTLKKLIVYICDLQMILGAVTGLNHLWFMTAIALCYLLVPFLQYLKNHNLTNHSLLIICSSCALYIYFVPIFKEVVICLTIFSFTYLYASLRDKKVIYIWALVILCLFIASLLRINWHIILNYSNLINKLLHITLGILCVVIPLKISNHLNINTPPVIKYIDKYSYYVYITHHIYLFGPLSLVSYTNSICINLCYIIVATCVSTFLLYNISLIIQKQFIK